MIRFRALAVACLVSIVLAGSGRSIFAQDERESLRGLGGIEVVIDSLDESVERDGLDRERLLGDMRARLRLAGIEVYSTMRESFEKGGPASPYLSLRLNAVKNSSTPLYSVAIDIELRQRTVSLVTGANLIGATWHRNAVMTVDPKDFALLHETVRAQLDAFADDYRAVN